MISRIEKNSTTILKEAGFPIILLFVLLPLTAISISFLNNSVRLLLLVHIASGFVWFILVIGSPIYCLISIKDILPSHINNRFISIIPKLTILAFGMSITTVISGTLLFVIPSSTGSQTGIWRTTALLLAWFIFALGIFGPNRYHVGEYIESNTKSPSNSRINRLRKRNLITGSVESVLIISFVIAMNFI